MTPLQIPVDTGDFRLMDRKVIEQLNICEREAVLSEAWLVGLALGKARWNMSGTRVSPAKQNIPLIK